MSTADKETGTLTDEERDKSSLLSAMEHASDVERHLEERVGKLLHEVEDLRRELRDIELRLRYLEGEE